MDGRQPNPGGPSKPSLDRVSRMKTGVAAIAGATTGARGTKVAHSLHSVGVRADRRMGHVCAE